MKQSVFQAKMHRNVVLLICTAACMCLFVAVSHSEVRFVSPLGSHETPFTSWESAATNIAEALAVSKDGDEILVGDGIYILIAELRLTNAIAVRGVSGPTNVIIDGGGSNRVFYLSNSNALIEGFTIRNGYAADGRGGAGILCETGGTIRACVIAGNYLGGGTGGGGVFLDRGGVVQSCVIVSNIAYGSYYGGGGVSCGYGGAIINSIVSQNVSFSPGTGGGGGVGIWGGGLLRGSVVSFNTNHSGEAYGGGGICVMTELEDTLEARIENCTIVNNLARGWVLGDSGWGGGLVYWGAIIVENSIIYSNQATGNGPNYHGYIESEFNHCCTTPLPSIGTQNMTNNPFLDWSTYKLSATSPCIDAGTNSFWVFGAVDIDGHDRVFNSVVDIGADEAVVMARDMDVGTESCLTWDVIAGAGYQLQASYDPTNPAWVNVGPGLTAETFTVTSCDTNMTADIRMYRMIGTVP